MSQKADSEYSIQNDEGSTVTRRDFLKLSAVAGGVTAVTLVGLQGVTGEEHEEYDGMTPQKTALGEGEYHVYNACSPNCWMGCPHLLTVRDGRIVNVTSKPLPDPAYRRICLRGLTNIQQVYHPHRVKYPMKRIGERGGGEWARISWDEAIQTISDRILEVKPKYGGKSIVWMPGSGDYGLLGVMGIMRLMALTGGTLPLPFGIDTATPIGFGYVAGGIAGGLGSMMSTGLMSLLGPGLGMFMSSVIGSSGPLYSRMLPILGSIVEPMGIRGYLYLNYPDSNSQDDWVNTKTFIIWANSPFESQLHDAHFIMDAKAAGAKIIVVDPRFSSTAARADLWVPIKNGTDVFFGLGLMNIIINEDIYDHHFVKRHTCGPFLVKNSDKKFLKLVEIPFVGGIGTFMEHCNFSELTVPAGTASMPALHGEFWTLSGSCKPAFNLLDDMVDEWTPERVAEICDIPVEMLYEVAHNLAQNKPGGIRWGFGCDRQYTGDTVGQVIATLLALTGNFGNPGNICGPMAIGAITGAFMTNLNNITELGGGALNEGAFEGGLVDGISKLINTILPPDIPSLSAIINNLGLKGLDEMPDHIRAGNVKMIFVACGNMLGNQMPDRNAWTSSLVEAENMDGGLMIVVADKFMTPSAELADIVLPVAHWYETNDIAFGEHPYIPMRNQAIEPLWEAKEDWWIGCQIAKNIGQETPLPEDTASVFESLFGKETYAALREKGTLITERAPEPHIAWRDLTFGTDSGRLHFYNDHLLDVGQELPYGQWGIEINPESPEAAKYPIILTTQHGRWRVHSSFENSPWTREINPEPLVEMSRKDAEDRRIAEGDVVKVFNDRGFLVIKARVTDAMRPGGINIQQGWWKASYIAGHHQNLTHRKTRPMTRNFNFFDVRVNIVKVDSAEIRELQASENVSGVPKEYVSTYKGGPQDYYGKVD